MSGVLVTGACVAAGRGWGGTGNRIPDADRV